MRGANAKRLRREVYGDGSSRNPQRYEIRRHRDSQGRSRERIVCADFRGRYRRLKKAL